MSSTWKPPKSQLEVELNGLKVSDVKDETIAVIARVHHNRSGQMEAIPVVQPIVHSSTYQVNSVQHFTDILNEGGYIYVRLNNPTCEAVECSMNLLERGAGSVVFGSGMAAISTTLLSFLKAGDHVVCYRSIYSGSFDFVKNHLPHYGIEVTFVGNKIEEFKNAIKTNTKVLYGESPSNPLLSVMDLEEFGKLGLSRNIITMIDATCASPYLVKPIEHGIDIVLHSGTKFLGGHSDLCAGIATSRTEEQWRKIFGNRKSFGGILSPFEASLLLRGLKTLAVRVDRQCDNAMSIAQFLDGHPMIDSVNYSGLKHHPEHELAKKQMKKFGAMVTFDVKGGLEPTKVFVQSLRVIQLAVSLGGVDSLISHPASMTHGPMIMTDEDRRQNGIGDGQVRYSVGIEDVDDLKNDIKQALDKAAVLSK